MQNEFNGSKNSPEEEATSLLTELLAKAKQQGFLLSDDLLLAIPEAEENMAQLEELFIQFVSKFL